MNVITLLRGCPAIGKSTFIKKHNLENYTLSTDKIRLLLGSPIWDIKEDGITPTKATPFKDDNKVFDLLFDITENRMKNGDLIFIDAQNISNASTKKFKRLANTYKYRLNIVDFKDEFTLDEVLENNHNRIDYKVVPDSYIRNQYEIMFEQSIPSYANVLTPAEFEETMIWKSTDLSAYDKVLVFGDIHGCYTALSEVISNNTLDKDTFYIFLGDFFDRGVENAEVFDFLFKNKDAENIVLLRGNHENHLFNFTRGEKVINRGAKELTIPEILRSGYTPADIKALVAKIQPFFAFKKDGQEYICNHGGVLEQQLNTLSVGQYALMTLGYSDLVTGLGGYDYEIDLLYSVEQSLKEKPLIQFHGHRNNQSIAADEFEFIYNLEGGVEHGGYLRVAELTKDGIKVLNIKNDIVSPTQIENSLDIDLTNMDGNTILHVLRNSKLVREKRLTKEVSGFNFTRQAFQDKKWNQFTITARGLFLDRNGKIVYRGYPKFFNLDENDFTTLDSIEEKMEFPVRKMQKENGFLGILGYNPEKDTLQTLSKGGVTDFSKMFNRLLFKHFKDTFKEDFIAQMDKLKALLKEKDTTLLFEVIDTVKDPHIVRYDESKIVLLHAIKNDFTNTYFTEFCDELSAEFLFERPNVSMIDNMNDLKKDIEESKTLENVEGFVYEGVNHYMFKLKTDEYNHYKFLRGVLKRYAKSPKTFNKESFDNDSIEIQNELLFLAESEEFDIYNLPDMIYLIQLFQREGIEWTKVEWNFERKKAWLAEEL